VAVHAGDGGIECLHELDEAVVAEAAAMAS